VRVPAGIEAVVAKSVSPLTLLTVSELPSFADSVTGLVPVTAFSVIVPVAFVLGWRVVVPLADPAKPGVPDVEPGMPSTGAIVNAGGAVEMNRLGAERGRIYAWPRGGRTASSCGQRESSAHVFRCGLSTLDALSVATQTLHAGKKRVFRKARRSNRRQGGQ
jgi:hypothetical protein